MFAIFFTYKINIHSFRKKFRWTNIYFRVLLTLLYEFTLCSQYCIRVGCMGGAAIIPVLLEK